jgi:ADP-ribose pyrophosphatase YjhB (NUDIX family)
MCGAGYRPDTEQPWVCTGCGNKSYRNSVPTAEAVLFNANGEVLLAKRAIEPNIGLYDIPGGFLNYAESVESAVVRELDEELGLKEGDYEPLVYCTSWNSDYAFSLELVGVVNMVFTAKLLVTEIQALDDVAEIMFVNLDMLDKISFSYPDYPDIIRKAHSQILKG